jgi:hypothetical protein
MYRPIRVAGRNPDRPTAFSVLTWEFPVLAKYSWARWKWRPFVTAGPSLRLAGNLNGYNPSRYGITAGGGVETRVKRGFRLSPAVRYTHWAADRPLFQGPAGPPRNYPRTNRHSVALVFGISF